MDSRKFENFESMIHRLVKEPEVILFGSRWLGTQRPTSDIDLVIVSPSFQGLGIPERRKLVEPAKVELEWRADFFTMAPRQWAGPGWLRRNVDSQHGDPDEWRRWIDKLGRKITWSELLHLRATGKPFEPCRPRGLGDTVAKVAKSVGADKVAAVYEKITGKPCGCAERQEKLNELVPYNP